MAWSTKIKDLSVASVQPHPLSPVPAGVTGRAPVNLRISFTPTDFFGAAARCTHMHVVNPAAVTPESFIISSLVEQHVDDTSPDFAVLKTADTFKDDVKSYFAGTVAARLAYLQMIGDGYVWADHFENFAAAGAAMTARTPDFVFSRPGQGN